jgi:hypothetical protein
MTLKNAIIHQFRHSARLSPSEIDSAPSRAPESGRIWAALTRKGGSYGESQIILLFVGFRAQRGVA